MCFILLLTVVCSGMVSGAEWGYDEKAPYGPSNWAKLVPACGGLKQSPININWFVAKRVSRSQPVRMEGSDKRPTSISYTNDGHGFGLAFTYPDGVQSSITGGPLGNNKYTFHNLHIHWKSEHTVNSRHYDAEVHVVHFNSKYATFADALPQKDGLAVLGLFYNIPIVSKIVSFFDVVRPFINGTQFIREPKSSHVLTQNLFTLNDILTRKSFDVWSYDGSLTTPTCNEVVTWLVHKSHLVIYPSELTFLNQIKDDKGVRIANNYRPVQPLNSRTVYIY